MYVYICISRFVYERNLFFFYTYFRYYCNKSINQFSSYTIYIYLNSSLTALVWQLALYLQL